MRRSPRFRLGRFAGDMALLYDARGGIYLWGPLLRKMERLLRNDVFRHRLTGERAECRTVNRL
ncbi:glucokinase [Sinorhizobium meliloti SM11]|nr:glucokinase [Sinorhizobium meliloti]MDE4562329.1 glucokinase [Sinorhizobium meliloti SM11]